MFTILKIVLITALLQGIPLVPGPNPSEYLRTPIAGDTTVSGKVNPYCATNTIFIYSDYKNPEELGHSTVNHDGTFSIPLNRPLRAGEKLWLFMMCGIKNPYSMIDILVKSPPPPVPEPATVTLVGSGLAALGLRVLRSRRQ